MKKKVQRKMRYVIMYFVAMLAVLVSNFFAYDLEILLKLRPKIHKSDSTQVHFIDVGQGDAIAIKLSNGETMLVDSGISDYRSKLTTYLDNVIIQNNTLDHLVLTHPDIDHSSNIEYILKKYNVKNFYRPRIFASNDDNTPKCYNPTYDSIIDSLSSIDTQVKFHSDLTIIDENVSVVCLDVLDMYESLEDLDTNQFSPIIIISDNDKKVMLTGDISSETEEKFIEKYSTSALDIDILKLAHHGSKYSTSELFLKVTSPDYVVATVGENSYGHPANDTLARLVAYDQKYDKSTFATLKSTLSDGNIVYTLDQDITINEIDNIDNYNFTSYFVYSIIVETILVYFYLKPYFYVWKRNIRFYVQNRRYEKNKEKENNKIGK